jgi:RNA polymerase sigma factor (sigma-70 family)
MIEDAELLRRYAEEKSEAAFGELVRRHVDLVYGVAHRQVGGDVHLAQDVTQVVFIALARKAAGLAARPVLAGWLHRSAQFAAIDVVRAEQRRRVREQEVHAMTDPLISSENSPPDWERLRPLLDRTIAELGEQDRDAVVLRFFNGRSFADIGASLRVTENAARMRVERALEKLRTQLSRRGVTSTTAALSAVLVHQAGVAAPAGLAAAVTGATLGAAAATTAGSWLLGFMGMTKLQMGVAGAVALLGAAAYVSEGRAQVALRQEIAQVNAQQGTIAALHAENRRLAAAAAEVEMLRRDDAELERLARGVAVAKQQAEARRIAQAKAPRPSPRRIAARSMPPSCARMNARFKRRWSGSTSRARRSCGNTTICPDERKTPL